MKRFYLLIIAVMFLGTGAFAQNWKAEIGMGASRYRGDISGDSKFSYSVGLGYEFQIHGPFSIMPQFNIVKKGSKGGEKRLGYNLKSNAYYFEIPVMALYRVALPEIGISIVPQAGLYLGYGFGGKTKASWDDEYIKVDTFSNQLLKEGDFGAAFKLDVEWADFTCGVKYGLGLKDLAREDGSVKNGTILFTLGMRF